MLLTAGCCLQHIGLLHSFQVWWSIMTVNALAVLDAAVDLQMHVHHHVLHQVGRPDVRQ
jgi:hypothetical protein